MTEQPVTTAPHGANDWIDRSIVWMRDVLRRLQLSGDAVMPNLASATLWRRLGAAAADGVILWVFFKIVNVVARLSILTGDRDFWIATISPIQALLNLKPLIMIVFQGIRLEGFSFMETRWLFFAPVFAAVTVFLYHAVMESSPWQATFGKKLFGVVVTGLNGERISLLRAAARTIAKSVAWLPHFFVYALTEYSELPHFANELILPCLLGLAIAFASRRQQTLHDAIANTLVARVALAHAPNTAPEPLAAPPPREEMKQCPACAEWIRKEAKKCRYCQERFAD